MQKFTVKYLGNNKARLPESRGFGERYIYILGDCSKVKINSEIEVDYQDSTFIYEEKRKNDIDTRNAMPSESPTEEREQV